MSSSIRTITRGTVSIARSDGPDESCKASHGRQAAKRRARVPDVYFREQSEL